MISKMEIEILNDLTIAEFGVLRYLDKNKEKVLQMSIQTLADQNFVSTATIMRLSKKLGFSGFAELKFFIKEQIRTELEFSKDYSYEQILKDHAFNITKTVELLEKDLIIEVVNKMTAAKNIHFFGKGLTSSVCEYYSKILFTLGINNFIYKDTHIAYLAAENMNEDDLVFIASLSGNTNQVIRMAQIAKSRKATVISITSNTKNELAKLSNLSLSFASTPKNPKVADAVSRTPALFIFVIIVEVYIAIKNKMPI